MNTIPSVGPEPAIAPRTGSGSPQTTPQQRADVAPVVISDSGTARADPGVMLKITPPVGARQGDVSVPQHALPGEVARTLAELEAERSGEIRALLGSATDADEAVATRLSQAFAALPPDVQEAIRQSTTPGIAQLLRLASLTASGIKEAPARISTGSEPLAFDAQKAAQALLEAIRMSAPFKLAEQLRAVVLGSLGADATASLNASRSYLEPSEIAARQGVGLGSKSSAGIPNSPILSPVPSGLANAALGIFGAALGAGADGVSREAAGVPNSAGVIGAQSASQGSSVAQGATAAQAAPLIQGTFSAQGNADGQNQSAVAPLPFGSQGADSKLRQGGGSGGADMDVNPLTLGSATREGAGQALASAPSGQASSGLSQSFGQASASASVVSPQAAASAGHLVASAGLATSPALLGIDQAEAGLRDALRLLMDGRMVWQGQFTSGVPMALERADAWRANRRETGGMEKGTSLRLQLQLPNLGKVEVRALGFRGQVAVRVHAEAESTGDMVGALPQLQARLRERGLAGAQVVVESL